MVLPLFSFLKLRTVLRILTVIVILKLATKWRDGFSAPSADDISEFNSGQLQEFLDQLVLESSFSSEEVQKMSDVYKGISDSQNSEVRFRWIRLGLKSKYEPAIDNALAMVTEQVHSACS